MAVTVAARIPGKGGTILRERLKLRGPLTAMPADTMQQENRRPRAAATQRDGRMRLDGPMYDENGRASFFDV